MGAHLMSPTEHSRLLMERIYSLIRYRSQRAASMLISDGSNGELLYRWLSRKSPRLPQGEKWLRILEHLRWRRYHQFPFHMVGGCRRGGKLIGLYGREPPEFPDCSQNWVGRSEPIILLMNWIAGDQEFARYELPFLISLNRSRPCNISRPTRLDWIRIAECALWKVFGYRVQDLSYIDWKARSVWWRHNSQIQDWILDESGYLPELPLNPFDLLTSKVDVIF